MRVKLPVEGTKAIEKKMYQSVNGGSTWCSRGQGWGPLGLGAASGRTAARSSTVCLGVKQQYGSSKQGCGHEEPSQDIAALISRSQH